MCNSTCYYYCIPTEEYLEPDSDDDFAYEEVHCYAWTHSQGQTIVW